MATSAVVAALCGVGSYALFRGFSRNWDGFWMVLTGLAVGGSVLEMLAWSLPRYRRSDGPGILGANCGVPIMAAVWLYAPAEVTATLGAVCRVSLGALIGLLLVDIHTYEVEQDEREQDGDR